MGVQGKQIVLCGTNDTFIGALRLLLSDFEVVRVRELTEVEKGSALLVYHSGDSLPLDELSEAAATVPTLILAEPNFLIDSVESNCRGFLPDSAPLEQIRDAIQTILDGGAVVPPDLLGKVLRHLVDRRRAGISGVDLSSLTDREREVFHLAAQGARKDEIGERLYISPDTARTHLQRVYHKLGVHSHAELIALATRGEHLEEVPE